MLVHLQGSTGVEEDGGNRPLRCDPEQETTKRKQPEADQETTQEAFAEELHLPDTLQEECGSVRNKETLHRSDSVNVLERAIEKTTDNSETRREKTPTRGERRDRTGSPEIPEPEKGTEHQMRKAATGEALRVVTVIPPHCPL
ncbi:hypothetical protein NDU88_004480 [Pleurodeles waltl]|uniref:Uncharacterized protein n=1 Tax=Pleurodeles waltl TaxID=8319 RepID=A0AAV7W951_PLEWA|nr:hypothetical protein NDU88_004480 [Pleurodeles waltl]